MQKVFYTLALMVLATIANSQEFSVQPFTSDLSSLDTKEEAYKAPTSNIQTEYLIDETQLFPLFEEKFEADIRILNKRSNKTSDYKIKNNQQIDHSYISISANRCIEDSEDIQGNNAVWISIMNKSKDTLFEGWMFAKLPGVTSLEHSLYDVIILGCRKI